MSLFIWRYSNSRLFENEAHPLTIRPKLPPNLFSETEWSCLMVNINALHSNNVSSTGSSEGKLNSFFCKYCLKRKIKKTQTIKVGSKVHIFWKTSRKFWRLSQSGNYSKLNIIVFLKNGPIPGSFSFIFVSSTWHNYNLINV